MIRRLRYVNSVQMDTMVMLVESFARAAGHPPIDHDMVYDYVAATADTGVLIVDEEERIQGFIAGAVVSDPVRPRKLLVETGWFSMAGSGMRLLTAFQKVGEAEGCEEVRMSTLSNTEDWPAAQVAETILLRMGYEEAEKQFVMPLENL